MSLPLCPIHIYKVKFIVLLTDSLKLAGELLVENFSINSIIKKPAFLTAKDTISNS
jgi:hypothetical protein